MRNLDRDRQRVFLARYLGTQPKVEDGLIVGNEPVYEEPVEFFPTRTMARGEAAYDLFGQKLDYDTVLTIDDPAFHVSEADLLWVLDVEGIMGGVTFSPNRNGLDGGTFEDWNNDEDVDAGEFPNAETREHDYIVRRVARKGDFTVIAAERVEVSE